MYTKVCTIICIKIYTKNVYKNPYKNLYTEFIQKSVETSIQKICTKSVQRSTLAPAALITDQAAEFQNSLLPPDNSSWLQSLCRVKNGEQCFAMCWNRDPI